MIDETPEILFPLSNLEDSPVVEIPERLTVLEALVFKQTVGKLLLQDLPHHQIFLDFSQTRFIDSSGIGALIANFKLAQASNIELILESVQPPVMATLSMTGLCEILSIKSSAKWSPKESPETHPSVRSIVKRLMDIVGAIVGLSITGVIFIPVAIAIKSNSKGPISMYANAEALKQQIENQASGAFFKNDNDPRITPIGNFLRRTSLDELPQFWNVLKGDMSLVGTRPPTPEEVETYQIPEWQRLNVKPGMTGEWQVHGRSQVRNFEDVIKLDLRYQRNWNLRYDIKLIFKTLIIIFSKNNGAV
jgi:anti-anti-sigma factor